MDQKKILWIEDDALQLEGLVRPLKKDGHTIIVAVDEMEALEKLKKIEFDLIILDILIPSGKKGDLGEISFVGAHLLEKMLLEMNIQIPIIVLSVIRDQKMIKKMYQMGIKKFLQKGSYLPSKLKEEIYNIWK